MDNYLKTVEEFPEQQETTDIPQVEQPVTLPFLRELYFMTFIPFIKFILPSNIAFTSSGTPFIVIRKSAFNIFNARDSTTDYSVMYSPVQYPYATFRKSSNTKLLFSSHPIPYMNMLMSHQFVKNNFQVSLRITSNTSVTGSFAITEFNDVVRNFDQAHSEEKLYNGYRCTQPLRFQENATTYIINDLSLVRHIEIEGRRNDSCRFIDVPNMMYALNTKNIDYLNQVSRFIPEDIICLYPLTDITSADEGQITVEVIFNAGDLVVETPILPIAEINQEFTWYLPSDFNNRYFSPD